LQKEREKTPGENWGKLEEKIDERLLDAGYSSAALHPVLAVWRGQLLAARSDDDAAG
jgi:hypothetical protein